MKATDGPYVPDKLCCTCRVPVLRSMDNFWTGWGHTYCDRCKKHYAWGVCWPRFIQNLPRSRFLKEYA